MLKASFTLLALILISLTGPARLAQAAPQPSVLLRAALSEAYLKETEFGLRLMGQELRINVKPGSAEFHHNYLNFLDRLKQPGMSALRRKMAEDVQEAEKLIRELRTRQGKTPAQIASRELSAADRILLEHVAARRLRSGEILKAASKGNLEPGSISFLEDAPAGKAAFEPVPPEISGGSIPAYRRAPSPRDEAMGIRSAKDWIQAARKCVQDRPPSSSAATSGIWKQMLQDIGIGQAFTVGGYIASSGAKGVDWRNLGTDMLVTLLATGMAPAVLKGNPKVLVRWIRAVGFGQGVNAIDATIYHVAPWTDTHGVPRDEATLKRLEFNAAWSLAMSPLPIGMYALFEGMRCLNPGLKTEIKATTIQLAVTGVRAYSYFSIRNLLTAP